MGPALEVFTISIILYEGIRLTRFPVRKVRSLMLLLLILASGMTVFSLLPHVKAETAIGPISPLSGAVGSMVNVGGNISRVNEGYEIRWDDNPNPLASGNASGFEISASFKVPEAKAGSHNITLVDVESGEKSTGPFTVVMSRSVKANAPDMPKQLQEGDVVSINASVAGGEADVTYIASITVKAPNNASYTNLISLTTSSIGSGNSTVTYPNDFPSGANTSFTGQYLVFFNDTSVNATFFVGLTNSTEYHRGQIVNVRAVYTPSENVTVTISGNGIFNTENVTADNSTGLIHYTNWTVPSNAPIGSYTVNVTSITGITSKTPPDMHNFTISGYTININTVNLAGENVTDVILRVYENGISVANGSSGSASQALLWLESGDYTCKAYLKNATVGEELWSITGEASLIFNCSLTNLLVTVTDKAGHVFPEIALLLGPDNQTLTTEINGTAIAHSLLPNITYTLSASRYNKLFYNETIDSLPAEAWHNIIVICPTYTMQVNVTNANGQPINDAVVKAQEYMGGLYYENITANGFASLDCTLGAYVVGVYADDVKLNETFVELFDPISNVTINCGLYGLTILVHVTDYFGQSIPNVNVTMQVSGLRNSSLAGGDGTVVFSNALGGDLEFVVRLAGQAEPCVVARSFVGNSTTVDIKIEKYVILAGLLVETSRLLTVMVIVLTVILILFLEVLRRWRQPKPQKSESQS
jgi:hypothetical protein